MISGGRGTAQPQQRQHLVAQLQNFVVVHLVDFRFGSARDFHDRVERYCIQPLLDPEQQRLDDGQRERQLQPEGCALARTRLHADRGFETVQHALDDVHSDATPGNFGDLGGRAETRTEDEIEGLGLVQQGSFLGRCEAEFDGFGANFPGIDAAAVVADLDDDLVALMIGVETDHALRRLTRLTAFFGRFNAVADGVADQVRERLGDRVENSFVEIGLLPAERQFHVPPALPGDVADHAREAPEQLLHGYHADLHHRTLQIVEHARLEGHGVGKLAAQQFLGIALGEFAQRLLQHRLADDELAHQVQHAVDASGFHAQDVFLRDMRCGGFGRRSGGGPRSRTGRGLRRVFAGSVRRRIGFYFGLSRNRGGSKHHFDGHFLSNGRDAAKGRIPTIAQEVTVEVMLAPTPVPAQAEIKSDPAPDAAGEDSPETAASAAPGPAAAPSPETAATHVTQENILRVEAGRIDSVLNLVGELIIGKSMLQQALSEFSKRYPKELLRGKFADAMAFQARVLNDLQRSVMKIRMVPVDQLFRRFPRMVRDVSRQCGREVEVDISGQDTDLDKGILDAIAEPLTHLVRNAVSHGIEPPDERRKLGKAARGVIRLNAYHHGNQVVVEVIDDGRGIDAQKIRAKAIELGMTTAEEAARLSEAETLEFIFRPGFSTAEQVTEVSGRGVGMDVVQSVLHRLKATISVETRPGQGTTFRLKLPLTLAIIKALLFWVEQRLYAIPLNAVLEIARTFETEVHQVDNYEVLQLRNQVLPLLRLGRPVADDRKSKLFVLVITVGERKYGLIVDALEGEEELVIKALDDHTFHTDLVSGASILGDGRVVLILNLPAVVEHVARARPEQLGQCNSGLLLSHTDRARLAMAPIMTPAMGGQA